MSSLQYIEKGSPHVFNVRYLSFDTKPKFKLYLAFQDTYFVPSFFIEINFNFLHIRHYVMVLVEAITLCPKYGNFYECTLSKKITKTDQNHFQQTNSNNLSHE